MNEHIKIDDVLDLEVRRMGINGEGIAYYKKLAIFVDHAIPGEKVKVKIKEVFENRAIGEVEEILVESHDRMIPFCPVYHECGGCQTQHVNYLKSLEFKRDIILKSFDRYASLSIKESLVKATIGSTSPLNYRNKASLPVQFIKGKNRFGMYQKNSNVFIPIDECPIQHDDLNRILRLTVSLMNTYDIKAIDPKTKDGYIRNIIVRIAEHTNEVQVSFICFKKSNRLMELTDALMKKEPNIVSVYEVINNDLKKPGFFTSNMHLLRGKETIEEILNGYRFELRPDAFFQLNTRQADLFYQEMKRLAKLKKHEIAIDAYAGSAPVSHYIYDQARHVYAIELDKASCESAKASLEKNNITNVTVLQSDFKRALISLKEMPIDVMFFDPPRVGLGDETLDLIIKAKPKRLIYGSCNPSTLAKDINRLLTHYELIEVVPIDMFPYTSLVESVSLLILKTA